MNRPERHNALSTSLIESLTQAVTDFREDPDQKVLILTGAGTRPSPPAPT